MIDFFYFTKDMNSEKNEWYTTEFPAIILVKESKKKGKKLITIQN